MLYWRSTLNLVVEARDQAFQVTVKALGEVRELVVAAKQAEIDALRAQISRLEKDLAYEKSRGDALVDRLLVRDAHVAAVAPVAVAAAAERDVETAKKRSQVQAVFDELATIGDLPPARPEARAFEFPGGGRSVIPGV